ncbi:hypothetical protein WJX73_001537 [Symbiochloris irregularis]|uniref:RNA polymerase II subunit A C-terminal domain phosphatase SSU72 n=1 Tax=Symbiochloris irregularis TaxID=706552 RepID=A0AAW1PKI8_9CHLO
MQLKFAMVCAANNNRSMAAHELLQQHGMDVKSYGVGTHVRLPGPTAHQPNVFNFGTPYSDMHRQLQKADESLYTRNGILPMLARNMKIKQAPERWQDSRQRFDIVVTFEERVQQQLMSDMNSREQESMQPCLVVNIDVTDNHAEAGRAAPHALRLCQMLEEADDWEDGLDEILTKFEGETGHRPVYDICFY